MTLVVVALHCEAKPLIKHFNLKKDQGSTRLDVYSNRDIRLIISGVGIVKCAVATTYLLALLPCKNDVAIFNLGICGAASKSIETGTPVLFNKIINNDTKRSYYPDMLLKSALLEGTLQSFSSPVTAYKPDVIENGFVDMEAAGFMEAAAAFLPPHNTYCLKIVSDHLSSESLPVTISDKVTTFSKRSFENATQPGVKTASYLEHAVLDPAFVSGLIQKNLHNIEHAIILNKIPAAGFDDILSPADHEILNLIRKQLMLSVTMSHQFKNMAIQYKIRNKSSLDCLTPFFNAGVRSKYEGKIIFGRIKELLINR